MFYYSSSHGDLAACVGWISSDEVLTCGDDHKVKIWSTSTLEILRESDLPENIFPTCLDGCPKTVAKGGAEVFVMSSSDGRVHLLTRHGRIEKSVDAHTGAAICVRWAPDATAIVSSGEDGVVKIWSKSLMLRSTFSTMQGNGGIYSVAWSVNSDSLAFPSGIEGAGRMEVKALSPNSKPVTWKAHDGIILSLSWNHNNLIVSGGEDRRFKVWDSFGRLYFVSQAFDAPITTLSWSRDASLIAVGSFNRLNLCADTGYSLDAGIVTQPVYSVLSMVWSQDSSQLASVSSSGHLLLGTVIERRLQWKSWEVLSQDQKLLQVREIAKDVNEELDFKDTVVRMSLSFGHLIVITSNQGFVYSLSGKSSIHSGYHSFDMKSSTSSVHLICQSERTFLLIDSQNVSLMSYEGRLVQSLKWPGMRPEILNERIISLSPDTLAVKDSVDVKNVTFVDTQNGKVMNSYHHTIDILNISLDQIGSPLERKMAFVDKNTDLYIHLVRRPHGLLVQSIKLQSMAKEIKWSEDHSILCATNESGKLLTWSYPQVAFIDHELLPTTMMERDLTRKISSLLEFNGSSILLRSWDGSLIQEGIHPLLPILHTIAQGKKWKECLSLCRLISSSSQSDRSPLFWSTLTGVALVNKDLDLCEVCYTEIDRVDKVNYIQKIKGMKDPSARSAEIALLSGNIKEAENILLQSGFIVRAVLLNLELFQWTRAMEVAKEAEKNTKDKTLVKLVLSFRKRFLESFNKKEQLKSFIQAADELGEDEEIEEWKKFDGITRNPYERRTSSVKISSASSSSSSSARASRGR